MVRQLRLTAWVTAAAMWIPLAAYGQFPSEVVGFNGPPIDDPGTSQEMFRTPQLSGTTSTYILANVGAFDNNAAFRASGLQTEGPAALQVFFRWVAPNDPYAWVRLTTSGGALRPNPALHTGGKVRFKFTNKSELFLGNIGLCLGIRETGVVVPQLADAGGTGEIEWVGTTGVREALAAGPDGIVNTTAQGDDVQVYPVGTNITTLGLPASTIVVGPGPNGLLDTTPQGDDAVIRTPIPAATLAPSPVPYTIEFNLATGTVSVNGVNQGGGIRGFTGDGVFQLTRGTLEHIALVNVAGDSAVLIDVAIDELQFEAPEPDPVIAPRVVAPIIAGDTQVTVTDLLLNVNQVNLLRNGSVLLTQNVGNNDDVIFTLPAPAVTGDVYSATQRDGVTGITSVPSLGVVVFPEPSPYSFSIVIDEIGSGSCLLGPWEHVGVTAVDSGPVPYGIDLFPDSAVWQTIDFALDSDELVLPWFGGNGVLNPSPSGLWSMDSIWLTRAAGAADGPYEFFLDTVEILDADGNRIETVHDMESGVNYLLQSRGQSPTLPTSSALSTLASFDGQTSHRMLWTFTGATLGQYHNIGFACNTAPKFTDAGATMRFRVLVRGTPLNDVALPTVLAPVVGAQTSVRVGTNAAATAVQLFINGEPVGAPVAPTGTETIFSNLTLALGDSVSATQVIGGVESDFAYPRGVAPPAPPALPSSLAPGATSVTVSNLLTAQFATTSFATVYVNDIARGTAVPAGASVVVNISGALVGGDVVTATQTVNGAESRPSTAVVVGFPAPIIFKAPSPGNVNVRVQGLPPQATQVTVRVNDATNFNAAVPAGATFVEVPVTNLQTGNTIKAFYTANGILSSESIPETVTIGTTTTIVCDSFEYDEATYTAQWVTSTGTRLELSTEQNATTVGEGGGTKSLKNAGNSGRVHKLIAELVPTPTNPVVWNVDIYDSVGPGAGGNNFAQLNDQTVGFTFIHIGVSTLGAQNNNNYYQLRALGNGGPDWTNLDQYDAPQRSIGWHNFTFVHKGLYLDVYVDGRLARKNIPLTSTPSFDIARIGPGVANTTVGYYDDYCLEVGPVRFGVVPPPPPVPPALLSPIQAGDTAATVTGVQADVTQVRILDAANNTIGTYAGAIPPDGIVNVPLTRTLVHLERIRAQAVNASGASLSTPLEAGVGNGDILIALGLRETGDAGAVGSPGSTTGSIEWLGVTSVISSAPQGVAISPANAWQTLVFNPSTDPVANFLGNGILEGSRGVLEHIAVSVNGTSPNRSSGPYRLFIDNVMNVDAGGNLLITDFESVPLGAQGLLRQPSFSGSTAANLAAPPNSSAVVNSYGNPGRALELNWFWRDTEPGRWLRLTTFNTPNIPNPIVDFTKPIRVDVLLLAGCPTILGDLNGDFAVNFADFGPFANCLGGPTPQPNLGCICADFNGDGRVDLADFAEFQLDFTP